MEFPLRNLNDAEKAALANGPIWVGILIGCADGEMNTKEIERIEEVIRTKTFSEQNDVHYLYKELTNENLKAKIEVEFDGLGGSAEEKADKATANLEGLNSLLAKVNSTYAAQYRDSLHDIAVEVAKAAGGILGIGSISSDEKELLDLPMINKF